jgi:hypothetical protein
MCVCESAGRSWRLRRSKFHDGDGMVPCAGNAGVRRGFAGERKRGRERGERKEKGVAT